METILTSIAVVAIAKAATRPSFWPSVLAARFRKPPPIVLGIFAATLLNHAVAAVGYLGAQWLTGAEPATPPIIGTAMRCMTFEPVTARR